jgi:hypothetical protein
MQRMVRFIIVKCIIRVYELIFRQQTLQRLQKMCEKLFVHKLRVNNFSMAFNSVRTRFRLILRYVISRFNCTTQNPAPLLHV